jgi:hypothetical protein
VSLSAFFAVRVLFSLVFLNVLSEETMVFEGLVLWYVIMLGLEVEKYFHNPSAVKHWLKIHLSILVYCF